MRANALNTVYGMTKLAKRVTSEPWNAWSMSSNGEHMSYAYGFSRVSKFVFKPQQSVHLHQSISSL